MYISVFPTDCQNDSIFFFTPEQSTVSILEVWPMPLRGNGRLKSSTFLQNVHMPSECFPKLRAVSVATTSERTHGSGCRCPGFSSPGSCRVNLELWFKARYPVATLPLWSLFSSDAEPPGTDRFGKGVNKFTAVRHTHEASVKRRDSYQSWGKVYRRFS